MNNQPCYNTPGELKYLSPSFTMTVTYDDPENETGYSFEANAQGGDHIVAPLMMVKQMLNAMGFDWVAEVHAVGRFGDGGVHSHSSAELGL